MITVVRKPFASEGRQYESGDLVESSYWRNEQGMLHGSGHLRPASEDEIQRFRAGAKNIRDAVPAARRPAPARAKATTKTVATAKRRVGKTTAASVETAATS